MIYLTAEDMLCNARSPAKPIWIVCSGCGIPHWKDECKLVAPGIWKCMECRGIIRIGNEK